jgi:hypothetical protein
MLGLRPQVAPSDPGAPVRSAEVLHHKPCRLSFAIVVKISQSLWGTGIALVAFSPTSGNSMQSVGIVGCPHDGFSEWLKAA